MQLRPPSLLSFLLLSWRLPSVCLFSETTVVSSIAGYCFSACSSIAISVNLARGRTHDCHCFGQLYSRPLGWPTLLRNIIFMLGAGFVLWQAALAASPKIVSTLATLSAAGLDGDRDGSGGDVSGVSLSSAAPPLKRLQRRLDLRPADRFIAPDFELPAYHGGKKSLAQLLDHAKPLLLLFTNPHCGPWRRAVLGNQGVAGRPSG